MRTLYKKFKNLTGKRGADLASSNSFTRQYISLLVNSPTPSNNKKLGKMMRNEIANSIADKQREIEELKFLDAEIWSECYEESEVSA